MRIRVLVGGCVVLAAGVGGCGTGSGAAGVGQSVGSQRATTTPATSAPVPPEGGIWTRVDAAGIAFRRPGSWRSFPDPFGTPPGPAFVVEVVTTQPENPCSTVTHPDGSGAAGCRWKLAPGAVEVMWTLQAQPRAMPATSSLIAGRRAVRTTGPATGECRAAGGARQLHVILGGTGRRAGVVELVVDACLAAPGVPAAESQVNAMLDSLTPRT